MTELCVEKTGWNWMRYFLILFILSHFITSNVCIFMLFIQYDKYVDSLQKCAQIPFKSLLCHDSGDIKNNIV